jgi:hypothetical protein
MQFEKQANLILRALLRMMLYTLRSHFDDKRRSQRLAEGQIMNLAYAVERLLETGWMPDRSVECEMLPDGQVFPSVLAIQQAFARAGLELAIKHNMMFSCYRATWAPIGEPIDASHDADERHGTVVGACEREAAVYALAQLRTSQLEHQLASV